MENLNNNEEEIFPVLYEEQDHEDIIMMISMFVGNHQKLRRDDPGIVGIGKEIKRWFKGIFENKISCISIFGYDGSINPSVLGG